MLEAMWRLVVLLLHEVHNAGAADVHARDCPFNRLMTDLRQGAEAAFGAAAA